MPINQLKYGADYIVMSEAGYNISGQITLRAELHIQWTALTRPCFGDAARTGEVSTPYVRSDYHLRLPRIMQPQLV